MHPQAWYDERRIALLVGCDAVGIDPVERLVTLMDGDPLPYDRLIITAGAHAFIPPFPGVHREGVFALRTLADVAALSFTAPIFATMLAIFVLGEVVRVKRWIAILAGLGGALLILRPGLGVLETGHLLTLFSAACWAIALTIIKVMARTESALTITIYMVLLMTPLSLGPALFYWTWPTWTELGWMALIGAVGTLAQLALTEGLKRGDTNVVMPLDFFKLVWAALIGFVLFAEVPDAFTWAGGAVIFVAATYIALRERSLKKDTTPTPRTPAQS
jgi:drug/metabolite transporter (DMT)-like permease